jgi:hypothetical protein
MKLIFFLKMTLKKKQSQPMLTFKTRDRDHEARNYRAKGKPKKQRSKILNKKNINA